MFWISSYELGPEVDLSIPLRDKELHISLGNSLISLNSRPVMQTESYYYSFAPSDFVKNPHSNMDLLAQNVFSHIEVKAEWVDPDRKFSLGYEFEFIGYSVSPTFKYVAHTIQLNWKLGTS